MSEPNKPPALPYAVFCGLDVGKSDHHACALAPDGTRLHDKALPNDETALREVFTRLAALGPVLVVVDQPASIGALAIAVARSLGIEVAYLPGLAMRRIADLHPGEGKTDARDAYVIADAARTMPHTLRRVGTDDETLAGLTVLAGYDDDLAAQSTRLTNRLRDALLHVHPALERLLGKHLDRGGVLDLLAIAPTPAALAALEVGGIAELLRPRSPRLAKTLPANIQLALAAQSVTVPGTAEFGRVIAGVAAQLRDVHTERLALAADLGLAPGGPPSCRGPDLDARRRAQDRHQDPHHRRRRQRVPHGRAPRRLRRPRPRHPTLRVLDQGRDPLPARQPRPQVGTVLVGIRQSRRPHQPRLLRPQTRRRQAPQRRTHLPRPTPRRRHVRHAPRPHALHATDRCRPDPRAPGGLTAAIETPPGPRPCRRGR